MKEKLNVKKEYVELVPEISPDDFGSILVSMREKGFDSRFPIVVDENYTVLDGHNRMKAAKQLGIEPVFVQDLSFKSEDEKIEYILRTTKRKNLNSFQKAEQAWNFQKWKKGSGEPISRRSDQVVAKREGVSEATFKRAKFILEKGPEGFKDLCRKGEPIEPIYETVKVLEAVKYPIPEETKKTLVSWITLGLRTPKEVIQVIRETEAVKEKLQSETEEIEEKAEVIFSPLYYTEELDSQKALYEIAEIARDPHHTVTRNFPLEKFRDFDEAQKWAVERDGVCRGKVEMWRVDFDPVRDRKLKKS